MKHPTGFLFLLFCAVFLSGCSNKSNASSLSGGAGRAQMAADYDRFESELERPMASNSAEFKNTSRQVEEGQASIPENTVQTRKLVKRANLRIRVEDPSAVEKPLADLMDKYGAWAAATGVYEIGRAHV